MCMCMYPALVSKYYNSQLTVVAQPKVAVIVTSGGNGACGILMLWELKLLGSEHTFKHTPEFLQSSFYGPKVAAPAFFLHASNETQCINVWLLFLIAITDILDRKTHFLSSSFPPKPFCIFAEVITRGLAKQLTDSVPY